MDSEIVYEKLMNASLNFVSYRPRSQKEVAEFIAKTLKRWKVEGGEDVRGRVITRLIELNYLDDVKFATWWIAQRSAHRPKGPRALQFELQAKGISSAIIAEVFQNISEDQDSPSEFELAQKAIQKKRMLWNSLPEIEQKKKAYSFLALRGFSAVTISKIIDGLAKKAYN